ncbi:hypothetical protein CH295_25635 [Rhodococcus sp. 14-2483-1-2]|nr:hypothetical protein CH295_25635 [Rhodococcus sp. 14-2483-1-2]
MWSIPEALEMVDLGSNVADALAIIIDAPHGYSRQLQAVVRRDGGQPRRVNLTVRVQHEEGDRILRGISHEVGVATPESSAAASSLSDLVVGALTNSMSYLAVVDLYSLEAIFWYGTPPDDIVWRSEHRTGLDRIHPDSMPAVKSMSNSVRTAAISASATDTIKLLNRGGHYTPFVVTAAPLSLGTSGRAGLVTLTRLR